MSHLNIAFDRYASIGTVRNALHFGNKTVVSGIRQIDRFPSLLLAKTYPDLVAKACSGPTIFVADVIVY